jgi:hypothetical protein
MGDWKWGDGMVDGVLSVSGTFFLVGSSMLPVRRYCVADHP